MVALSLYTILHIVNSLSTKKAARYMILRRQVQICTQVMSGFPIELELTQIVNLYRTNLIYDVLSLAAISRRSFYHI